MNNQNIFMNQQYNNYNQSNNLSNNKSKKIILIIILLIAVLGVVIFIIFKSSKTNESSVTYDSKAFFLKNSENKYALFDENGNKLTDFIFTYVSSFVNGKAVVEKNDEYGIINDSGKMTVDFSKYSHITDIRGMFEATNEDYHHYLIDGNGKVLFDMEDISFLSSSEYLIFEDEKGKNYKLLNDNGKVIDTFPFNKSDDEPSIKKDSDYVAIFYDNKNYIYNLNTGKKIISFNSDSRYCIEDIDEDNKIISLNLCNAKSPKVVIDGKLKDFSDKCGFVYNVGGLYCGNGYTRYLIDSNLNVGNIDVGIDSKGVSYVDNNGNYAIEKSGSSTSVDFYNNGSIVKNVECRRLKETGRVKDYYVLASSCGYKYDYEYYNVNGERMFDKTFKKADKFDSHGLAQVSDDGDNYYLIDKTGKRISDDYSDIALYFDNGDYEDYYIVEKNKLMGIIDVNGKVIVDCIYSDIDRKSMNNKYAILKTTDSKYILYDITNRKEIMKSDIYPNLSYQYFSTNEDGVNQYYTYNGKLIYESK